MKKFLNIRNILIIILVALAVIYIFFIRSNHPDSSKTSALFYNLINKDVVTMNISFKEQDKQGSIINSIDQNENKAVQIIETYDYSEDSKRTNTTHFKSMTIRENKKAHIYQINYDLKKYTDFGENEDERDLTDWIESINSIISESKYYTRYYKIIDNTIMLVEKFPEQGYVFIYDGDELKYIQQKDGFSGNQNTLYEVQIEDSFIDDSLIEIPNDFTINN